MNLVAFNVELIVDGYMGLKPGGEDAFQKLGLDSHQISLFINP